MSNLLLQLIKAIVSALCVVLSPENVRKVLDAAFDAVERKVQESETQWDDAVVLPMLSALRVALNVPDDDEDEPE